MGALKKGHLQAFACSLDSAIIILEFPVKSPGRGTMKVRFLLRPFLETVFVKGLSGKNKPPDQLNFRAGAAGWPWQPAINPFDGSYQVF